MTGKLFECRACGQDDEAVLLEMGEVPLANAFVKSVSDTADAFRAPLTLVMCRACSLIQLRELVPREQLFSNYIWVTGTSAAATAHAVWLSQRLKQRYHDGGAPLLVEIASNDGHFLRHYREAGFDILGVDPSNVALEADAAGLTSIRDFFGRAAAERIIAERGPARLIVARNVLGHSEEMRDLVAGAKLLLAPGGRFIIEVPYAYFLRNELQYDTIFHEHVAYLTVTPLSRLLASFQFKITDISFVDMNGGSLLCEVAHEDDPTPQNDRAFIDFENLIHLNRPEGFEEFTRRVHAQREAFVNMLQELSDQGHTVVGYGAAAKCMTMLGYCGIDSRLIEVIGDANPRKQGLLCPGVHIPVVSPEQVMEFDPDEIVIGAWNFKDEIIRVFREQYGYRKRFIVPLPSPEFVS